LKKKGIIAEGMDADLIIVNVEEAYEINPLQFASKAKFSPFERTEVKGKVLYSIVGGRVIL